MNIQDKIAAHIRKVDGNHTMGAGLLGESIAAALPDMVVPLVFRELPMNGWKVGKIISEAGGIIYRTDTGWLFNGVVYSELVHAKAAMNARHAKSIMSAFGVAA